jgi:hypothetical protein
VGGGDVAEDELGVAAQRAGELVEDVAHLLAVGQDACGQLAGTAELLARGLLGLLAGLGGEDLGDALDLLGLRASVAEDARRLGAGVLAQAGGVGLGRFGDGGRPRLRFGEDLRGLRLGGLDADVVGPGGLGDAGVGAALGIRA